MAEGNATRSAPFVADAAALDTWNTSVDAVWDACADHKTCDSCLNASYACHFCEKDFQCHAIGSISGCLTGISQCHHLEDCERKEPQHVGYGPPPSVVIAVLCLVVTMTCCLCGFSAICSVFLRSRKRRDERAAVMAAAKKNKKKNTISALRTAEEPLSPTQVEPLLGDDSSEDREHLLSYEDDMDDATLERLHLRRESESISVRRVLFRLFWIASLIVVTVLALMFYPRMPDYNVCNREFEWESILQSLRTFSPKIEYDVLISVINENRFGFVLEQGKADIYHNNTWVGQWNLNQSWEAKAGAISDVIAPIRLDPGYLEGIALWKDFQRNALIFRINASITGYITWGKHKIYRISSSVPDVEFLVGAEYDRDLCMCKEFVD